jgi:hypothetical protein
MLVGKELNCFNVEKNDNEMGNKRDEKGIQKKEGMR